MPVEKRRYFSFSNSLGVRCSSKVATEIHFKVKVYKAKMSGRRTIPNKTAARCLSTNAIAKKGRGPGNGTYGIPKSKSVVLVLVLVLEFWSKNIHQPVCAIR